MRLDGDLAMVQVRVADLGRRIDADERWLVRGFLADGGLSPQRYLARAERHKVRQRELLQLTKRLLMDAPPRIVA